jgi:hypothetical protein
MMLQKSPNTFRDRDATKDFAKAKFRLEQFFPRVVLRQRLGTLRF